jgi:pseudouridine synthase
MEARLQKILAQWGIASRREAEEMIRRSRVQVNGSLAELGQKVDPNKDTIYVDGQRVSPQERPPLIYLLLNKPAGVVSTCSDPQGRKTVLDLLPPELRKGLGLHPVGRLDADSTGALILTNDGDMTFALTHPRHSIPKTYEVLVKGHPDQEVIEMWRNGIVLEGRKTRPAEVNIIKRLAKNSHLEIVLKEGRNRQIRRVAEKLGYPVIKLHRTAIGPLNLQMPNLPFLREGHYRCLKGAEIRFLQEQMKHLLTQDLAEVRSAKKA